MIFTDTWNCYIQDLCCGSRQYYNSVLRNTEYNYIITEYLNVKNCLLSVLLSKYIASLLRN